MKKYWSWIIKHKFDCLLLFGVLSVFIFLIPIIINLAYNYDSGLAWLQVDWETKDALAYYGSILSFLGTTFLGCAALYQSSSYRKEDEKSFLKKIKPVFTVRFIKVNQTEFSLEVRNITDNVAKNIHISDKIIIRGLKCIHSFSDYEENIGSIGFDEKFKVTFKVKDFCDIPFRCSIEFICFDIMGNKIGYIILSEEEEKEINKMKWTVSELYGDI